MKRSIVPLDDLDGLLAGFFRPGSLPGSLERRIIDGARAMGRGADVPGGEGAGISIGLLDRLSIEATPGGVARIDLGDAAPAGGAAARWNPSGGGAARRIAARAREEMSEYLHGRRAFFSVPVDLSALPEFQRQVLQTALRIPFGEARSYAWIARRIDRPRATRAVGTALARNPVPFIVPCHRVLRTDGGLGGYALGLPLKRRLLEFERGTPVLEGRASTGIVCRVGCRALRRARPDTRIVFATLGDARSVGYRPCAVCRPSGRKVAGRVA
jgi:O-6-methylguanine DNA methyltransferase